MTRINLVHPNILTSRHLVAEYKELTQIIYPMTRTAIKGNLESVKIPEKFCLNGGHVKFFYDKAYYLEKRYIALNEECKRRNVKINDDLFNQHFGRGHVVLSSLWGGTSSIVDDFFDAFALVVDGEIDFTLSSTRVGSFAISRTPKYTPTMGQNQAMEGSTSRRIVPIPPSVDNLFVTEQDQGLGDAVDLESGTNINPYNGIDRYGYTGSLCHRIIRLCVDGTKLPTGTDVNAATFYNDEILPRLILLLGRAPQYGDYWYDGTRLFFNSGDQWQSS